MSRWLATPVLAITLALAACARDEGTLPVAARRTAEVESGVLSMSVLARADDGAPVGFELSGPFSFQTPGDLPVARLTTTRVAGDTRTVSTFTSTGKRAFVTVDGQTRALEPSQLRLLRLADDPDAGGALGLDLSRWVTDPRTSDGPVIDGVATTRVRGRLAVGAVLGDLAALSGWVDPRGTPPLPELSAEDLERLDRLASTSAVTLVVGRADKILRQLSATVRFDASLPPELPAALGAYGAAVVGIELELADPGRRVEVEAPVSD